jgi:membrane associated rhomboid family serine protease
MGETERYLEYKHKRISFGDDTNALFALVALNGIIFVLIEMIQLLFRFLQPGQENVQPNIANWFRLSANVQDLLHQPWTLLSAMFTHTSFFFILTNMIWLWAFGTIFQLLVGNNKLIPLYIYGGLAGAVGFIISYYTVPSLKPLLDLATLEGANAAIMAIAVATTILSPGYKFFTRLNGGIPIWVLTLAYFIIDIAGAAGRNTALQITHLSGALVGFLFVVSLRKGYDWTQWMNDLYHWFITLFDSKKRDDPRAKIREKMFYKTGKESPFTKKARVTQQRVDDILDKISQKGYQSLTEEEKDFLKRAGESDLQ